jgi:hypothetical protein
MHTLFRFRVCSALALALLFGFPAQRIHAASKHVACCGSISPAGMRLASVLEGMNVESPWLAHKPSTGKRERRTGVETTRGRATTRTVAPSWPQPHKEVKRKSDLVGCFTLQHPLNCNCASRESSQAVKPCRHPGSIRRKRKPMAKESFQTTSAFA